MHSDDVDSGRPGSAVVSAYADQTAHSRSFLRRISHRSRIDIAASLISPRSGQRILDYGACTGDMLRRLYSIEPTAHYEGYEINDAYIQDSKTILKGCPIIITNRAKGTFDTISCLETLEHVPLRRLGRKCSLAEVLAHLRDLLAPEGRLIISVPIEIGPPALIKNVVRALTGGAHANASIRNVLLSVVYLSRRIDRTHGHIGFDFRELKRTIPKSGFVVRYQQFSPVPWLGSMFNSQVLWIVARDNLG